MLPDLLGEEGVGDELDEVVDGVDAWVDGLEALDLLPDGQGVGHVGREVALVVGHDEASQSLLIPPDHFSHSGLCLSRQWCLSASRWVSEGSSQVMTPTRED